ncbi:esterase [Hyphodiscus hymeniophilus]|uniref:Esterase n=1 Tax=Hyphodiscus hymeniophilus TaxID=353542 RepID=A0A9P6VQH4_9HELO|nr:esterase [Hyphodiscus hymeniophilus]
MAKLRVLCLHGFTTNGAVLAEQTGHLTKALSSDFEFIFPDGPHEVDISAQEDMSSPQSQRYSKWVCSKSPAGHRAWWYARDPNPAANEEGHFEGLERSLEYLGDLMRRTGPFDVILGFSQGGCFSGLLTALLEEKNKKHPLRSKFPKSQGTLKAALSFSGFKPRFQQYDGIYAHGIDTQTLHVMGEKDLVVTVERSEVLAGLCRGAKVLKFEGGHQIPQGEEQSQTVIQFLRGISASLDKPAL